MMDWPEARLRLTLWLHRAWPFRVLSWVLERGVPHERGFGPFRPPAFAATSEQIQEARACLADAERTENSIGTRIDTAINAISLLEPTALFDADVKQYLHLKYYRALTDDELTFYYATVHRIARELLSKLETK